MSVSVAIRGVVGARHGEFVIDIDDRRGTSGPKPGCTDALRVWS